MADEVADVDWDVVAVEEREVVALDVKDDVWVVVSVET